MKYAKLFIPFILGTFLTISCETNDDNLLPPAEETSVYFPPIDSDEWQTTSPQDLEWNLTELENLKQFLIEENSKSFMVLHNGKIVVEEYFNGHSPSSTWRWNSAGKTLVTAITGIAQQNGFIDINNKVSDYIGQNWTSTTPEQEALITVKSLLSMTSGLDDVPQLVIPSNLTYIADAGTRWAYGNVFQRLMNIIETASGIEFENYFNTRLADKIGMDGFWNNGIIYRIYHSNTRSMARFGLWASQNGHWDGEQIHEEDFFVESQTSSQNINPSYGYLWWLNGKSQHMLPATQTIFPGALVPNAPADMVAAMGKDEQRIYIVPSQQLVIIRNGEATTSGDNFALSSFDNLFWEKFNAVIN